MTCTHPKWANPTGSGSPLACTACGVLWPGEPLPVPAHDRPGYGEVAKNPSWRSRVDAMKAELAADERKGAAAS